MNTNSYFLAKLPWFPPTQTGVIFPLTQPFQNTYHFLRLVKSIYAHASSPQLVCKQLEDKQ